MNRKPVRFKSNLTGFDWREGEVDDVRRLDDDHQGLHVLGFGVAEDEFEAVDIVVDLAGVVVKGPGRIGVAQELEIRLTTLCVFEHGGSAIRAGIPTDQHLTVGLQHGRYVLRWFQAKLAGGGLCHGRDADRKIRSQVEDNPWGKSGSACRVVVCTPECWWKLGRSG